MDIKLFTLKALLLCALNFLVFAQNNSNQILPDELQVEKEANNQSIQKIDMLESKLSNEQIQQLQRENAELRAQLNKLSLTMAEMNKQASVLSISAERSLDRGISVLLEELQEKNLIIASVESRLEEILQDLPRNPDRGNDRIGVIEEKLGRAIAILKKQSHIPSLVARRDGESIKEMKILAVSKALEVVVLNAGSEDGVRLGSTWILKQSEGDEKVTLNIVEVRRKICAAIVKEGQFSQVKIGDVTITGK